MAPTEQIIWEAKQRGVSWKDARRRPSTTVDETGCIVQRGFVVPSRSSSFDSRSAASSPALEDPGTPASPIDDAPPGFRRPTGSLMTAPELQILKPPIGSTQRSRDCDNRIGGQNDARRPLLDRRQTWQAGRAMSNRWDDDELESITCKSRSIFEAQLPAPDPDLQQIAGNTKSRMRRVKSEQVQLQHFRNKDKRRLSDKDAMEGHKKQVTIVVDPVADSAIASDSEEDDEDTLMIGGMAAQRKRPSYAERRARNDEVQAPERAQSPIKHISALTAQIQGLNMSSQHREESAIESDEEEEDEATPAGRDAVSAALILAQDHKTANASITSLPSDIEEQPRKPSVCFEIKTTAPANRLKAVQDEGGELRTPREIKKFDRLSPIPKRPWRPSRSQPRPVKGVLKKSGSSKSADNSPPKHVVTAVRCSSTPAMTAQVGDTSTVRFASKA